MTVRLEYTLTPRSRISAGVFGAVGNTRTVHSTIPGTVVRGALGSAWWSAQSGFAGADPQGTFDALFGRAMRVYAAVPYLPPSSAEGAARSLQLIPRSFARCKKGHSDATPDPWHDRAERDWLENRCPVCGGGIKEGFGWEDESAWVVSTTRTQLVSGAAVDEQLFTRPALTARIRLRGAIEVVEPSELGEALDWLRREREVSIGGQRSTLGRCVMTVESSEPQETPAQTTMRLVLRSPAILVDGLGAPVLDLAAAVQRVITDGGGSGKVSRSWSRPVVVSGWHGIAGLPKSEEWAVSAGSTVVIEGADEVTRGTLLRGLGVRRTEGYGEVEIAGVGAPPATEKVEDEGTVDRVNELRSSFGDSSSAVLTGMLAQARLIARYRAGSVDTARVFVGLARLPWMRALDQSRQDEVERYLRADAVELQRTIASLRYLVEGQS